MRHYLHWLVILSFVLSGISPACAFISGKASSVNIEICSADGMKIVAVPSDKAPVDNHEHHDKKNDCGFCFAQTHMKYAKGDVVSLALAQTSFTEKLFISNAVQPERFELLGLSARAPPLSTQS